MNLKNIYFSWLIYWGKMKGLLNGIAEAIILLASLASFFVLIYQFGFVQTPDSVHILERSRPFILLAFFTGITLRYVVRFQEIIQEKMLYLDISIYFLLFAVLSSKIFFKDAIAHSLPYLSFLTKPLFVYVLLLLLSTIHLSRQLRYRSSDFSCIRSHAGNALFFPVNLPPRGISIHNDMPAHAARRQLISRVCAPSDRNPHH